MRSFALTLALVPLSIPTTPVHAQAPVVNAPIAPDTIYVGRAGSRAGLSVIDLNGFGASTGSPAYDPLDPAVEGNSQFPNNPNVALQGPSLVPPLVPGTTTLDGGSAGVFTLTKNSALDDLVHESASGFPYTDMMLGASLDQVFNAGPAPFGCQSGGGNLCATSGLKLVDVAGAGGGVEPVTTPGSFTGITSGANPISFAPHPNPPPLIPGGLCALPDIGAQEPTSFDSFSLPNMLIPGDPFGDPTNGIPPSGLLSHAQNAFFVGPSAPQVSAADCSRYMFRQQIGHFLYAIDREAGELVVLNSNRFTVLDRIAVEDPVDLAMSPNLDFLAVSSRATGLISFVDVQPISPNFHQVVKETYVGEGVLGIAWDSMNEDILACNPRDGSLTILSAFSLEVRKRVTRGLESPFDVAITPRQEDFGTGRNVYYAWILERSGRLALFESGPGGASGWGYDAVVGHAPFVLRHPKAIQPDPRQLEGGVWIAHEGALDGHGLPAPRGGAITNLRLESPTFGQLPLVPGEEPNLRGLTFAIERSVGTAALSGIPGDLALDDQVNLGALPAPTNPFSAGVAARINGKQLVRRVGPDVVGVSAPAYLFASVPRAGVVDVIDLATGERVDTNPYRSGVQSIPAAGARTVMDYFRQ